MTAACPSQQQLTRLLDGLLDPSQEQLMDAHIAVCGHCRHALDRLTNTTKALAAFDDAMSSRTGEILRDLGSTLCSTVSRLAAPVMQGYEILEIVGQGATGVVYRAKQDVLGRVVALKLLQGAPSSGLLRRFRREAKAMARLAHTNVVQVYEIGEAEGRPYLALEFVPGGSLAQALRRDALMPPRVAARLMADVARGVHAAHRAGLVHRDLKPSNILLDHAEDCPPHLILDRCVPKVTDFGVAKDMHAEASLTQTSDLLGTPNYMAPEQVRGGPSQVGPAVDIWALGAILYECLTGQVPFRGPTSVETMLLARDVEPASPGRLRAELPRDLEAICLKCLEKESSQRYPSADALAHDLQLYLAGRQVRARTVGPFGRAWRWSRRNRRLTAITTLFAATVLFAATILAPLVAWREAQLRSEAEQEAQRADFNLELAVRAAERTLERVAGNPQLKQPQHHRLRKELFEAIEPCLEQFVEQQSRRSQLTPRGAHALLSLGRLRVASGQFDRAHDDLLGAAEAFARFATENPARLDWLREQAQALDALAEVQARRAEQLTDAIARLTQALALYRQLAQNLGHSTLARRELACCHDHLAKLLPRDPQLSGDIREHFQEALHLLEINVEQASDDTEDLVHLARTRSHYAGFFRERECWRDAESFECASSERLERWIRQFPQVLELSMWLAWSHANHGGDLLRLGTTDDGIDEIRQGIEVLEKLVVAAPLIPEYRFDLSSLHGNLGLELIRQHRSNEGVQAFSRALDLRRQLHDECADDEEFRAAYASAHENLAWALTEAQRHDEALTQHREAAQLYQRLFRDCPHAIAYDKKALENLASAEQLAARQK